MFIPQSARQFGGVAYREEDRGDEAVGGGGGDDAAAKAAADAAVAKAAEAGAAKAAEEKAAADKAEREKTLSIPKSRFDEAVGKERQRAEAAEKKAKDLEDRESQRNQGVTLDKLRKELDELEDKLEAKMAEGSPEERKAIRTAIRAKSEELADAKVSQAENRARALAVEQTRYDTLVERTEKDFPFLVPDAEGFNEALTKDLLEMKTGFEHAGMSSTQALTRSLELLKPALEAARPKPKEKPAEEKDEATKTAEAKAKAETEAKAKAEEARRREEAVKKGVEAAAGTPAKPATAGLTDKEAKIVDVKKISDKDFDKLPDDEMKRLRGDMG